MCCQREKLIVANLVGGLGNQMFQYACARSLALDLGMTLKFSTDVFSIYDDHRVFELEQVFGLRLDVASKRELGDLIGWARRTPTVRRLLSKQSFGWLTSRNFICEPHLNYWSGLRERALQGGYLHGYWQSERYFAAYAANIRADFIFREELQGVDLRIANAISQSTAISLHVRRGDYVSDPKTLAVHGTCTPEYYYSAIETLRQRCPNARFFAFSDDPSWVVQVLQPRYPQLVLVEHNNGMSSYNDMRLMSMCDHHIIANSSFSWWGAWLNHRPDKMVIAPARWFANGRDTPDLVPDNWERT